MKTVFVFLSFSMFFASQAEELGSGDIRVEWTLPEEGNSTSVLIFNQSSSTPYLLMLDSTGEHIPDRENYSRAIADDTSSIEYVHLSSFQDTNACFAVLSPQCNPPFLPFLVSARVPFHAAIVPLKEDSSANISPEKSDLSGEWHLQGTNLICRIRNNGEHACLIPVSTTRSCKCDFTVVIDYRLRNQSLPIGSGSSFDIPLRLSTPIYGFSNSADLRFILLSPRSEHFIERVVPMSNKAAFNAAVHRISGETNENFKVTVYCRYYVLLKNDSQEEPDHLVFKQCSFAFPPASMYGDSSALIPNEKH